MSDAKYAAGIGAATVAALVTFLAVTGDLPGPSSEDARADAAEAAERRWHEGAFPVAGTEPREIIVFQGEVVDLNGRACRVSRMEESGDTVAMDIRCVFVEVDEGGEP